MFQQIVWIILIIDFGSFCRAIRVANRSFPPDAIQENFEADLMREGWTNSLTMTDYDRVLSSPIPNNTFKPESEVTFYLFTRENPNEAYAMRMNDTENLSASPFDSNKTTKILIHGWGDSKESWWVRGMRKNYLIADDYNVLAVDWSPGNSQSFAVIPEVIRQAGEYLAEFLGYLRSEGNLSYDDVHILGFAHGAHVAGFAGAATSSQIGRITGLDPGRPQFEVPVFKGPEGRLDPSDARFVDVIHTGAGSVGMVRPIGHVDFYPNGGSFRQPGCPFVLSQFCSHGRALRFMMESIVGSTDFISIKCDSWSNYKAGRCIDNSIASMGENVNPLSRGKFFLETNSETPFARGIQIFDDLAEQKIA